MEEGLVHPLMTLFATDAFGLSACAAIEAGVRSAKEVPPLAWAIIYILMDNSLPLIFI